MKFNIRKSDITDILSKVQGITGRKSNLAITANILIKSNDSGISFIATDLETGFEGNYPAKIIEPGQITINARKFFEIVQNFPNEDICIEENEKQWIKISCDSVKYNIVGLNPEDFPDIPFFEDVNFSEIDPFKLKKMIERTIVISASNDEKRAHINGVYFESFTEEDKNIIRMVSTDGRRLNLSEFESSDDYKFFKNSSVIIPKKGLQEVLRVIDTEDKINIGIKDNYFVAKQNHETIIIGLLEGEFPDYREIVKNRDKQDSIIIDKRIFMMLLKRMSILSTENYSGVIFNFNKGNLQVNAINPEIGKSKEDLKIDYNGEPVEVAFNPRYFIDVVNLIKEENIILNIKDNKHPCYIEGTEDKSFLNIIMPMKL